MSYYPKTDFRKTTKEDYLARLFNTVKIIKAHIHREKQFEGTKLIIEFENGIKLNIMNPEYGDLSDILIYEIKKVE